VRATGSTGKQLDAELRPRVDALNEPMVEDRELGVLEHDPAHLRVDV